MRAFLSTVFCSLIRIARKHLRAPPLPKLRGIGRGSNRRECFAAHCALRALSSTLSGKGGLTPTNISIKLETWKRKLPFPL